MRLTRDGKPEPPALDCFQPIYDPAAQSLEWIQWRRLPGPDPMMRTGLGYNDSR
jgi:hypothetical protein